MSMSVTHINLQLKEGVLELTIVDGGRLALGQLKSGQTSTEDLIRQLSSAGIRAGFYDQGLDMIAQGVHDKVPVAAARVLISPGYSTMPRNTVNTPTTQADWETWKAPKFDGQVEVGDLIIQVEEPPVIFIQDISGAKEELSRGADREASQFAGAGTRSSDDNATVVADRRGFAFRTLFGEALVMPAEEIPGFARSHGEMRWEGSVIVNHDIREGARGKVKGTLVVEGNISGAALEVGGNVHIGGRADNASHEGPAVIRAGQTLRAEDLKETQIWAGEDVHITRSVERSRIQCLGICVVRHLDESEVRVGERLVAETVTGSAKVYLGTDHIETDNFESEKGYYNQHKDMLEDLQDHLNEHRRTYTRSRDAMVHEIERISQQNLSAAQRSKAFQVLLRQFSSMDETLVTFKKYLNNYVEMADKTERQVQQINYYQHRLEAMPPPEAVITGRLELGVTFFGPAGRLEIAEEVSGVRVSPDPITGEMIVNPL